MASGRDKASDRLLKIAAHVPGKVPTFSRDGPLLLEAGRVFIGDGKALEF